MGFHFVGFQNFSDDDSETADEVQPPKKKGCGDREDSEPLLAELSTCDVSEAHTCK